MTDIVSIGAVEVVLFGVLKVTWTDGFQALADLRPVLSRGDVFEFLRRAPQRFDDVKLAEFGHAVYWLDDDGDEIDFGADALRERAVRQAEILRLAS